MRRQRARLNPLAAAVSALIVAACGTGIAATTQASAAKPIVIGVTLSLTGQFSADGNASELGYQLWASAVNQAGGLLGRPVQLKILNDNSDPATVTREYTKLITADHVDLTLGPFSTLLMNEAAQVTEKYHYAITEGSGTGPAVYALHDPDLFSVSVPDADELAPFTSWIASLPASKRPTTAGYAMVSDPFADPPVQSAQSALQAAGVHTVYTGAPITKTDLTPFADALAAKDPQIVVLGSVDVPTVLQFIGAFQAMHFTPRILIATSGPDQGSAFLNRVGTDDAEAIMVPDGWYGGVQNALSHVMVQDYIAKYGGTSSGINADVAEAFSAGEVLADAVTATKSISNAKIISYLHGKVTLQTVQGAARFLPDGENPEGTAFIFQWQNGQFTQVLPGSAPGSSAIEPSKPPWVGG